MSEALRDGARIEVPVAILGAGPVGLALANELGWRGVPCLVIDRTVETLDFPTCESVNARTLEHFRRWGIADAVRFAGFPPDLPRNVRFVTRVLGHELLCFERPSNRDQQKAFADITPEGGVWCPKYLFDPVLRRRLEDHPHVALAAGWEVTAFRQHAGGVHLTARRVGGGGEAEIHCAYLAACDGATSFTRKALGIRMAGAFAEGQNFTVYFRSAALRDALADRPGIMMDIVNADCRANLSAVDGDVLWRLTQWIEGEAPLQPERLVHAALGRELAFDVIRALPWTGHRVVAERFRQDRVFLVGDAAHLLWPRGGFGMNTGVGDAVDLGWKLEAVLSGWGGPGLLDSYEAERRPVAVRNVEEAASNRAEDAALPLPDGLEADGPDGRRAREGLAALIAERRAKEWNSLGIQLGYVYADSPVCVPDGTPAPAGSASDYLPTTWPGARAPHFWLGEGRSVLDSFGRGFVLAAFDDPARLAALAAPAASRRVPLTIVPLAGTPHAGLYERRFVLVRPDGHVAWRGDGPPADPLAVIDRIRGAGLKDEARRAGAERMATE